MLTVIAFATLMFPAPGKYTYNVTTSSGAEIPADLWIYATSQGIVTHEEMRSSTPTSTTDQHFDNSLHPTWYWGVNARGEQRFIHLAESWHLTPWWYRLSVAGKTTDVRIDRPACVLVLDDSLTASVMLPSLARATGGNACTFIVASTGTTFIATIETAVPRERPKHTRPGDLPLTVDMDGITERLWYDPRTMIPDFIDLGHNRSAALATSTGEQ